MSPLAHDRERKFRNQLRLQIRDCCREDTLHKSLKQKLVSSFSNKPFFQDDSISFLQQ